MLYYNYNCNYTVSQKNDPKKVSRIEFAYFSFHVGLLFLSTFLSFKPDTENNANFDAVSSKLSEIFLSQVFWAATFGEQPRQAVDAHLLLLAVDCAWFNVSTYTV